ncbi:hypothetical protein AB0D38_38370, partial [Streptomyces sp. NPDC048279]
MYDQTRAQQPADRPPGSGGHRASGPEPLLPPEERDALDDNMLFADPPKHTRLRRIVSRAFVPRRI